ALVKFYIFGVVNLDSYMQSLRPKSDIENIENRYMAELMARYQANSHWKKAFPIGALIRVYCRIKTKYLVLKNCDNLNLATMRAHKLPPYYHVPFMLRVKLAWTLMV